MSIEDYIFATTITDDDVVVVTLQNKKSFLTDGYVPRVTDDMIDDLDALMVDGDFIPFSEHEPTLFHEEMNEFDVVTYLKEKGVEYSVALQEELLETDS